jgi:hypothetical protein
MTGLLVDNGQQRDSGAGSVDREWWPDAAGFEYLATFYHPRKSRKEIYRLFDRRVEDGTLRRRYRIGDGEWVEIDHREYWRNPKKEGADAFGWLEALEWRGPAQLTAEDRKHIVYEIRAKDVQDLCPQQPLPEGAQRASHRKGAGRHPKHFMVDLAIFGGA